MDPDPQLARTGDDGSRCHLASPMVTEPKKDEALGNETWWDEEEEEVPKGKVAAVVPAAGCGERMGGTTPKQYLTVCGRPLVTHCLASLEGVPWVGRVVVVADDTQRMKAVVVAARFTKVTVVQGNGSRHRSIQVGVEALSGKDSPDVVVVHDGVRPLLPRAILARVVVCAERHGAAGVVRPLVSTVVLPDSDNFLQESLIRTRYRNSEMPQAFRFSVLREAYKRCSEEELDHGTECLALALQVGAKVKLVSGPSVLWKVTETKDLVLARSVLPRHIHSVIVLCRALLHDSQESSTSSIQGTLAQGKEESSSVESDEGEHNPATLKCGQECWQVFHSIETSLRKHSKQLCISSSFDITYPAHSSTVVVVIAKLNSILELENNLQNIAHGLNTSVYTIIMVFTMSFENCDFTLSNINQIQQRMREVFKEHSGHATVLVVPLRKPSEISSLDIFPHEVKRRSEYLEEGETEKENIVSSLTASHLPCTNRLATLVTSLMEQSSGCFHGQVLVL